MNSDELGEKGESRFKEICADAGLICNKADRDRAGWDFIVEFPFAPLPHHTLDSRTTPLSCHVQVKTLLKGSNNFKMRLSSAERLAKELKPAFIYVFKVDQDLRFTDAFLVHLLNNRLGAILKRLRAEQAKGTAASQLNKRSISLTPSASERLAPTGAALRAALMSVCSDGLHPYSEAKNNQLKKLGFDLPPIEGRMTLKLLPDDDIGEVFLGLKQAEVLNFQTFTNRFGIKLPDFQSQDGKITIEPHPADRCSITVRDDSPMPPAVFPADVYFSAIWPHVSNGKAARIASNLFSLVFSSNSYEFNYDINPPKRESPEGWRQFWRMVLALSSGKGCLQIVSQTTPMNFVLEVPSDTKFPDVSECKHWMRICEDASYLLKEAGAHPEPHVEFQDIQSKADEILAAATFLKVNSSSLSLSAEGTINPGNIIPTAENIIVANVLQLGTVSVGYYRVAQMATDQNLTPLKFSLKATSFSPGCIRLLPCGRDSFDEFMASVMQAENISMTIRVDFKVAT